MAFSIRNPLGTIQEPEKKPVRSIRSPIQLTDLQTKTSRTTPQRVSPEFKTIPQLLDPRKKFEIRPPLAKADQRTQLRGGPVVQVTTELASRFLEIIPRIAAITVANLRETAQEQLAPKRKRKPSRGVDVRFDVTRLGFEPKSEEERTIVQSTGDRLVQSFTKRQERNPKKTKTNIALSVLEVPIVDAIDAFFGGDIATQLAKGGLKITKFDPVLSKSLQQLGLKAKDVSRETVKQQFVSRAERLITEENFAELDQLGVATNKIMQTLGGDGIPQLNKLGKFIQDTSRIALQDVKKGFVIRDPLVGEIAPEGAKPKELAGAKAAEGEPEFAFGLRIKKVEPVGKEPKKPAISKELEPLAKEARKFDTAEEFVKVETKKVVSQNFDRIEKEVLLRYTKAFNAKVGKKNTDRFMTNLFSNPDKLAVMVEFDQPIGRQVFEDIFKINLPQGKRASAKVVKEFVSENKFLEGFKTKSQLTDFFNQVKGEKPDVSRETLPEAVTKPFLAKEKPVVPVAKTVSKEEAASLEALAKQREDIPSGEQIDAVLRDISTGPEDPKIPRFTKDDLDQVRVQLNFIRESVETHPARKLEKFVSRATGDLPEVTGQHFRISPDTGKKIPTSRFGRTGDDIVTELGYGDVSEAQTSLAEFRDLKKRFRDSMEEFRADVKKARSFKELEKAKEKLNRVADLVKQKAETAEIQVFKNLIRRELSKTLIKVEGGIKKGQLDPASQKKIDKYREVMFTRDRVKAVQRIEKNKEQYTDEAGLLIGMPDSVVAENEMLQSAGLFLPKAFGTKISNARDIGKEGLERILENLRSIKETGKTKREIQRFNFQTEVNRAETKLKDTVLAGKELDTTIDASPVEESVIKKYIDKWNKYRDGHLNADFWALKAQSFSGDTVSVEGPFIDEVKRIHKARQSYINDTLEAEKDVMDTFYKAYDLKSTGAANKKMREMRKPEELGTFTLRNGEKKTIKLNRLQMIAKWMQFQQTHTKIRLQQGNQWTDEIFAAVTNKLTAEDKSIGRFLIDKYYPKFTEKSDPIYENLTGLYAVRVKNYSPSPTKTADIIPEHVKIAQQEARASLKPSSIKQRTDLLNLNPEAEVAPLEFDDPFITALTHATQMNRFIHFSEPVFFWRNLLKTGGQLRKALIQQFEREFPQQMERLLDDVARGRVKDTQNLNWLNSLTGNAATSILSLNITQTPKQLISSMMWSVEMSPRELARWMPHYLKNARSIVNEIYENSPFMRARGKKKSFDRDAKFHQDSKDMHNLVTGKSTFTDKGMFFVQFGDRGGILSFGGAFYSSRKAHYIAQGLSEKDAIKKAVADFEQAAKRIQQSGELEDIGMFQRAGGLARPLTLFQGTPLQFLRWEEHLIRSLGFSQRSGGPKAKGKKSELLAKILLIHFNFLVFQFISDGFEVRKERDIRAGILGPIGALFIIGSAIETAARIIAGDDVFDKGNEITGLTRMSDVFFDIPKSWKKALMDASFENAVDAGRASIEALLNLKGIPASNVTDLIESSFDFATQENSDPRAIIYSDYALDQKKRKTTGTGKLDLTKGLDLDLDLKLDLDLSLEL